MKRIAIIGSSGGNLYSLGGKDPFKLLGEIITQANSAGIDVSDVVFVGANASMDNVTSNTEARLFTMHDGEIHASDTKSLVESNDDAVMADVELSKKILNREVDGIIAMSADPLKTNLASFKAATETKIPIVGTGRTSMGYIQQGGANVIAVSGTTGTTNRTRAISAITTLSKEFGLKYRPIIGSTGSSQDTTTSVWQRISIRGIMLASLPAFIALALVLALSKVEVFASLGDVFNLLIGALPIVVAAIAAKQVSGLDEVGIVAGIMGGVYHAAILPIVLLEMETTGMSFLGAVDMVGLVMVSAGITLANIIAPAQKASRSLAVPGFLINIGFGTFVEAAYPYMFANKFVMATAIVSSTVGGFLVGLFNVKGTAYVPSLAAPGLANNAVGFAVSMVGAMLVACVLTILANKFTKEKSE